MTVAPHNKISPTAKFVAYLRTFTDIPYSTEIAAACGAEQAFREIVGENPEDFLWTAPMIEMRYKSVDEAIHQHHRKSPLVPPNLLELAAGVSPRGLIWSRYMPVMFLETDLEDILAEKTAITMDILQGTQRANLRWCPVNAVNPVHFMAAESFFEDGPITVLNEGLLPYLDREEKKLVAENIHRLLTKRGGVWVTPDISSNDRVKELIQLNPKIGRVMQVIAGFTGRNLQSNSFGSMEEAEEFFRHVGFKVTKYLSRELVPELSALQKVDIDPKKLDIMQSRAHVWVMEVQ